MANNYSEKILTADVVPELIGDIAEGLGLTDSQAADLSVNALSGFVERKLVTTKDELATAAGLLGLHRASPGKIKELQKLYPEFTIDDINGIYDIREEMACENNGGVTISGLAKLVAELGKDTVGDDDFMTLLAQLKNRIYASLEDARSGKRNYEDPIDLPQDRMQGAAFNMAVEEVLRAYENGLDIQELL